MSNQHRWNFGTNCFCRTTRISVLILNMSNQHCWNLEPTLSVEQEEPKSLYLTCQVNTVSSFSFQKLDSLGFRVFAGCLTSDGVERVTQTTSRRVMPLSLDVTDSGNVRDVVECMTSAIPPQLGKVMRACVRACVRVCVCVLLRTKK